jgi:hypothetical protein
MTGKHAPPEVTVRSYPDSTICDVVVVVRGQEMILRCRDIARRCDGRAWNVRHTKYPNLMRAPANRVRKPTTIDP